MFACSECVGANQTGPMLMKLTTICDISQSRDKLYQAFLSLIFFWGHREEGLGTRLYYVHKILLKTSDQNRESTKFKMAVLNQCSDLFHH